MSGGFSNGRGCQKGHGWVSKGVGGFFGWGLVGIGGVNMAVELAEAGAMLMWQLMWWRQRTMGVCGADVATGVVDVDDNGGDGADMAAETGGSRQQWVRR